MTNNEFINKIGLMAKDDMKKTKILASLTIAQAILESNWGKSSLSVEPNNNLFGIKGEYNGQYVTLPTKEYENGKWITINAKFRKYPSWRESIADHSALFNRLDRYKNLRGCTDYKLACKYVREDGYATDPSYTTKLINLIETYNLNTFDIVTNVNTEVNIYYAVKTEHYGWLSEVKNLEDYAGYKNDKVTGIKMKVDVGSIRYRATTVSGKKLGWVTGCNIYDYKNGWAGLNNGEPLAIIEAEYLTPKDIAQKSGYKYLYYKVNDYPYQIDLIESKSRHLDGYAGKKGVACTKFQAYIK